MAKREVLVFVVLAALVCANEVEDAEQKKRGAGKPSSLNAIPTGAQKPDYTYNIYSQNPSQSSSSSSSYQSQVPNSFYPSQSSNQYYSSANTPDTSTSSSYPSQPQINLIPPASSSQFVPLNFIPSPGYQSKYQIVPSKSSAGNIQVAIVQPNQFPSAPIVPYQQALFSPNSHLHPHQSPLISPIPQGHYNVGAGYQQLSLGSSYLTHPSAMFVVAPSNPSLYNNLLYPNPIQSFYNYYPSNSQAKYSVAYGSNPPQSNDYEKLQSSISQSVPKEDNDIHNSEYVSSADASAGYKSSYAASRPSAYSKLT